MAPQTIFKRYEYKYIITEEQKNSMISAMLEYMKPDKFPHSTIRNIYYDTDNYRLIRRSIEKPLYKEKLRIRSYSRTNETENVFVELKKKYNHIVYKRRLVLSYKKAEDWIAGNSKIENETQISKEIDYFVSYYKTLRPVLYLAYDRDSFCGKENNDLRITFDSNVICRNEDLNLNSEVYGRKILPDERVIMEIKCSGGMPLWLTKKLSEEKIYKTSFSKYGTAYKRFILRREKGEEGYDGKFF